MSEIVPKDIIEFIMGRKRHARAHYARVFSKNGMVYILHSKNCEEDYPDLRDCPFSKALDKGIDLDEWSQSFDTPVLVKLNTETRMVPARIGV